MSGRADRAALHLAADYPCLGALAAQRADRVVLRNYEWTAHLQVAAQIAEDLTSFALSFSPHDNRFRSFIASMHNTGPTQSWHELAWQILEDLPTFDLSPWPPYAPRDPKHPDFRFCFASRQWFVVMLSSGSSRRSRQLLMNGLAFNPSHIFDSLRARGLYEPLATSIRQRDRAYSGSSYRSPQTYPSLGDAPQYSGEEYTPDWRCPVSFNHK
mgnify:CR=1 FL=1